MAFPKQMKDIVYGLLQEPTLDKFREFIKNHTGECNYVIKLSDNKMESNSYYEYLDYEIMDKEDYMYIVEYFHARNTSGSIGDDIFNIYNIDKKSGKVVENKDIVNSIKNKLGKKGETNLVSPFLSKIISLFLP